MTDLAAQPYAPRSSGRGRFLRRLPRRLRSRHPLTVPAAPGGAVWLDDGPGGWAVSERQPVDALPALDRQEFDGCDARARAA